MAAQKNAWLEQQVQERHAAENERKKAEAAYMVSFKGSVLTWRVIVRVRYLSVSQPIIYCFVAMIAQGLARSTFTERGVSSNQNNVLEFPMSENIMKKP